MNLITNENGSTTTSKSKAKYSLFILAIVGVCLGVISLGFQPSDNIVQSEMMNLAEHVSNAEKQSNILGNLKSRAEENLQATLQALTALNNAQGSVRNAFNGLNRSMDVFNANLDYSLNVERDVVNTGLLQAAFSESYDFLENRLKKDKKMNKSYNKFKKLMVDIKSDYNSLSKTLGDVYDLSNAGLQGSYTVKKKLQLRSQYESQGKLKSSPSLDANLWIQIIDSTTSSLNEQRQMLEKIIKDLGSLQKRANTTGIDLKSLVQQLESYNIPEFVIGRSGRATLTAFNYKPYQMTSRYFNGLQHEAKKLQGQALGVLEQTKSYEKTLKQSGHELSNDYGHEEIQMYLMDKDIANEQAQQLWKLAERVIKKAQSVCADLKLRKNILDKTLGTV